MQSQLVRGFLVLALIGTAAASGCRTTRGSLAGQSAAAPVGQSSANVDARGLDSNGTTPVALANQSASAELSTDEESIAASSAKIDAAAASTTPYSNEANYYVPSGATNDDGRGSRPSASSGCSSSCCSG